MTKTIRLIVDIDVGEISDNDIEAIACELNKSVIPEVAGLFNSAAVSLPATGHVEVVTKYE